MDIAYSAWMLYLSISDHYASWKIQMAVETIPGLMHFLDPRSMPQCGILMKLSGRKEDFASRIQALISQILRINITVPRI